MDAGDWIAAAAVAISVAAAAVSTHQARTAKAQADAAREANQLTRQQMRREDERERAAAAEAEAAALREAEKVSISFTGNGGSLVVQVINNGQMPITKVELIDVRAAEEGPWESWTVNRNVVRATSLTSKDLLRPGEKMRAPTWLLDSNGQHIPQLPKNCGALVRFRDHQGQWWHVTAGDEPPARVDPPTD
jgi:Tfp pilus assembly protein PilV